MSRLVAILASAALALSLTVLPGRVIPRCDGPVRAPQCPKATIPIPTLPPPAAI